MRAEAARWRGLAALLAGFLALPPTAASAATLPPALVEQGRWQRSGAGEASWFGLKLYDAALWVAPGPWAWDAPFALSLRYARDFSRARLVGASIAEIERLFDPDRDTLARWREALGQALPDVSEGEVLVGLYLPGRGARFYRGQRLHSELADERLARCFFSIWLDERTRDPDLRSELLNGAGDG